MSSNEINRLAAEAVGECWTDIDATDDGWCEKHGRNLLRRECDSLGCDGGFYDAHDDDPLWYDEGEVVTCSDCLGDGFFEWCPECESEVSSEPCPQQTKEAE